MAKISYHPTLICPRCGKKKVEKTITVSWRSKCLRLRCASCRLELLGNSFADMESIWQPPKEKRLEYVIRVLKRFGNAYVGKFTLAVWDNDDICGYLGEKVGSCVRKRDPQEVSDGAVLYKV